MSKRDAFENMTTAEQRDAWRAGFRYAAEEQAREHAAVLSHVLELMAIGPTGVAVAMNCLKVSRDMSSVAVKAWETFDQQMGRFDQDRHNDMEHELHREDPTP